jgi:hypothetical protein
MSSDAVRTSRAVDRVQPQRDRLREAHNALSAACAREDASSALAGALTVLRGAFAEHVEYAEGPGGLFEELLDDEPGEAAQEVDRLKRDHGVIATTMDRAESLLAEGAGADDERLVDVTAELVRLLAEHRRRGAELLHNVYAVETGSGD